MARPTFLFGLLVLVIAGEVGGFLPQINLWSFPIWFAVFAVTLDFSIVTTRRPGNLRPAELALVISISLTAMLMVLWNHVDLWPIAAPFLGYLTMGVSLLILRGHPVAGTVGAAMMLCGAIWLGVQEGLSSTSNLERLAQPLAVIGGFWLLFQLMQSIEGKRSQAVAQQLQSVVHTDENWKRKVNERRALAEIPDLAVPLLQRIAAGEALTPEFHAELIAADDALRNRIRQDLPYHAGFLKAVDRARERGVVLRILGTEEPATPSMNEGLALRLIELLDGDTVAAVTIRFQTQARGGVTTLLSESASGMRRFEFDLQGNLLREPR